LRFRIGDQVQITLAVFLFLVGEAVEFLGERPQGFREQAQAGDLDRKLARPGLE
jgi:hypothetical protein